MKKFDLIIVIIISIVFIFFQALFLYGKLPIPADTIVGLYHPFRDFYSKTYPNGIPFKNFLITDPVRQQYPWRQLLVVIEQKIQLPLWNPYNLSGTPLLANFQSAVFYPFNILFFSFPFYIAWSILIVLQPLLSGIFIYLYLKNLGLNKWACLLGSVTFSFSGFSIAWLEWGTIIHTALWLPLILLSIDNVFQSFESWKISNIKYQICNIHIKNKKFLLWSFVFIFSLVSSFFAGHLQVFFYVLLFTFLYILARWIQYRKIFNILFVFLMFYILFFILTSIQWYPTFRFIEESARSVDQVNWQKEGWFIPWQHAVQFIAPDFFGNPTTLNYWGIWNYGELVGYVGIAPILFALFAMFNRHDKKTFLYGTIFFLAVFFSFPTFLAKIPYLLQIPFISSAQPTRLIFIIDFSLSILAALGLDLFLRKKKGVLYPLGFMIVVFAGLWFFVLYGATRLVSPENIEVARRNLFFPTAMLTVTVSAVISILHLRSVNKKITMMICIIIVVVTVVDLMRFGIKFTPFTSKEYVFPQTQTTSFLQKNVGNYRIMTTDSRIFPPNFSTVFRIQSVDGYDPLYLKRYGELIAASERGNPDISPPFGFNRIITPHNYDSKIIDLLGVKYILALSDIQSPRLKKVFQEGETRVYENNNVMPRAFLADAAIPVNDKQDVIEMLFDDEINLRKVAFFEVNDPLLTHPKNRIYKPMSSLEGHAKIVTYSENYISIQIQSNRSAFLVLTDTFYPTWHAKIDDTKTTIYRTDFNFRGVNIPKGKHIVEFYVSMF